MATATKSKAPKVEQVQNHTELVKQFKAARRAATPIVSIDTADCAATIKAINAAISQDVPKIQWDVCNGVTNVNKKGQEQIDKHSLGNVMSECDMIQSVTACEARTIVFVHMSNRFMGMEDIDSKTFVQGIWNLRDEFKSDKRTLVLLGPSVLLPVEIQNDVVPLKQPLPEKEALEQIVRQQYRNVGMDVEEDKVAKAVDAVVGLSAFQAEQVTAMSLTVDGLDVEALWERKRTQIEQTPGLSINREGFTFDDIGGLNSLKRFLTLYFKGKKAPSCIVFIDEIEKAMAGDGDLSGISQDQLGQTLQYMQDSDTTGLLLVGHPGGGKSAIAKATGNEFGIPTIKFDYGGMKGGIVGESEGNMRKALEVVDSVSGGNALFVATSNDISAMKSELKSRFKLGTYFVDLPTEESAKPIWDIHKSKRGLEGQATPDGVEGWTGREIENCCNFADVMDISLEDAKEFIVPICQSDRHKIEALREQGDGRWQDATKGKVYANSNKKEAVVKSDDGSRTISLHDDE